MKYADSNMRLIHKTYFLFTFLFLLPLQAHAMATFKDFVSDFVDFFNTVVLLIFAFAFLAFIWGVAQYVVFPGNEEKKEKGKQIIVWGIIVFVIMISVWGIVTLFSSVLL